MSETLEELKAIVENAPDGATHCDNVVTYYKIDSYVREWGVFKGRWCVCVGCNTMRMPPSMRSLSDIKRIIELIELLEYISALVFLEETNDSGKSHRDVCEKAKLISGDL